MFPMRYELGFYIPEYGILRSHRRENLKSYTPLLLMLHNGNWNSGRFLYKMGAETEICLFCLRHYMRINTGFILLPLI
jgi:hypothetical protein